MQSCEMVIVETSDAAFAAELRTWLEARRLDPATTLWSGFSGFAAGPIGSVTAALGLGEAARTQ